MEFIYLLILTAIVYRVADLNDRKLERRKHKRKKRYSLFSKLRALYMYNV